VDGNAAWTGEADVFRRISAKLFFVHRNRANFHSGLKGSQALLMRRTIQLWFNFLNALITRNIKHLRLIYLNKMARKRAA
jgi:restriction endonuclease